MDEGQLRRTPLESRHEALGATLVGFAGWRMPLDYGSVLAEHRAVREQVGVFDLSHLGTVEVRGAGAAATVATALTVDADSLADGRAAYALCLDERAGVVDDVLVYRLGGTVAVVPNAANTDAVVARLRQVATSDTEVSDRGAELAVLAVQGPRAPAALRAVGLDVEGLAYLDCRPEEAGGFTARSGYTGEVGFELVRPVEQAGALWDALVGAGVTPAGLGARDTLRLEMGYPLHGQDLDETTDPVAAGLRWAVRSSRDFVGREAYEAAVQRGARRRLRGLRASGRGIPRAHCGVHRAGQRIGETTSGTFSPTLRRGIALAYLDADVPLGEPVTIQVRGRELAAEVVRPPFVDADPREPAR